MSGMSGDVVLIDDPYDDRPISEVEREKVMVWFRDEVLSEHLRATKATSTGVITVARLYGDFK